MLDRLLTTRDVGEELGVSAERVRQIVSKSLETGSWPQRLRCPDFVAYVTRHRALYLWRADRGLGCGDDR